MQVTQVEKRGTRLDSPPSNEFHDFYVPLLADAIRPVAGLFVVMGIKVLVKDDNDASRSQIDAHAACAHRTLGSN